MLKAEKNLWDVTINDVVKVDTDDGDVLLVTMPKQSAELAPSELNQMAQEVRRAFKETFADKNIKVLVVPHGIEVQLIKGSELEDK